MSVADWREPVAVWRHVRAIALLPLMNTVAIPTVLLFVWPPAYPLQLMLAVFDFPEWSVGDDDHLVPALTVDHVSWTPTETP